MNVYKRSNKWQPRGARTGKRANRPGGKQAGGRQAGGAGRAGPEADEQVAGGGGRGRQGGRAAGQPGGRQAPGGGRAEPRGVSNAKHTFCITKT